MTDTCKLQKFFNIEGARVFELIDTPSHHYYTNQTMRGISMADAALLLFQADEISDDFNNSNSVEFRRMKELVVSA